MAGDHKRLVCRDHAHSDAGVVRRDNRRYSGVALDIQFNAKVGEAVSDLRTYRRGMFADPAGEDQGVEST